MEDSQSGFKTSCEEPQDKICYVFGEGAAFEGSLRDTMMHDRVGDRESSDALGAL